VTGRAVQVAVCGPSACAVIAVGGSWGTLSEIALAKRRGGIPVLSLGGWPLPGVDQAATPEEAVARALGGGEFRELTTTKGCTA
jgi:hypothetical protein